MLTMPDYAIPDVLLPLLRRVWDADPDAADWERQYRIERAVREAVNDNACMYHVLRRDAEGREALVLVPLGGESLAYALAALERGDIVALAALTTAEGEEVLDREGEDGVDCEDDAAEYFWRRAVRNLFSDAPWDPETDENVMRVTERDREITGVTSPYYALLIVEGEVTCVSGRPLTEPPEEVAEAVEQAREGARETIELVRDNCLAEAEKALERAVLIYGYGDSPAYGWALEMLHEYMPGRHDEGTE